VTEADLLTRKKYIACIIGTPMRQTVAHAAYQVRVAESHYTTNPAHFQFKTPSRQWMVQR
jgi:hypothetical protein